MIDEAEAEARSRLADAHEEADRIVAERLAGLAELTEEINAQAEALVRQAEALQRALAEAKAEMGGAESLGGSAAMGRRESDADARSRTLADRGRCADRDPVASRRPDGGAARRVPTRRGAARAPRAPRTRAAPGAPTPTAGLRRATPADGGSPAGARLLATQMAVSGSSRAEIEARLRNGFAITDTRAILDAILGPEN